MNYLRRIRDYRRFWALVNRVSRELIDIYKFILLEVEIEGYKAKGVLGFSPSGVKIFRETPKTRKWRYGFVKEALKYGPKRNK